MTDSVLRSSIVKNGWRRLHWSTLPIHTFGAVRALIVPMIGVFVFGSRSQQSTEGKATGVLITAGVFASISVAIAMWKYFSLRFFTSQNELIVEQGLIGRNIRTIRLEQIQDLRTRQGIIHRMLGVADVEIETAGGKGAEAKLSALSLKDIDELRHRVESARASVVKVATMSVISQTRSLETRSHETNEIETREVETTREIRRIGLGELVVAGLTSNAILSGLAVIAVAWGLLNDFIPEEKIFHAIKDGVQWLKGQFGTYIAGDFVTAFAVGTMIATSLLVIALVFSVAGTISRFFGFVVTLSPKGLVRGGGLFTKRSSTLAVARVQTMTFAVGLLRRPIGRMSVHATTAATVSDQKNEREDLLLPIARCDEAGVVAGLVFPRLDLNAVKQLSRVARVQIRRGMIKSTVLVLLLIIALVIAYQSAWPVLLLAALPLSYVVNRGAWRVSGFRLAGGAWHVRTGWLGWHYKLMPKENTQMVVLRQSPLDRMNGVVTLMVDCAGQSTGSIHNMPMARAREVAMELVDAAARSPWPARN